MTEEVAIPVQAAQLSHCMNAEMLAADPPVIWSIPSGIALAMNAPRNKQLGISMVKSCIASSVVSVTGIPSSNIEMMEAMTDKVHSILRQQLMSLYPPMTTCARRLIRGSKIVDTTATPIRYFPLVNQRETELCRS